MRSWQTPRILDVDVGGYRLTGAVDNLAVLDGGERHELLRWRIGRIRPQDRFAAWLELLAWVAQEEVEAEAHLVCLAPGEVQQTRFEAPDPETAREHLGLWLDAWLARHGATAAVRPRSRRWNTPSASRNRKTAMLRGAPPASNGAANEPTTVLLNAYVSLAYDGEDPFDEDQFADLAETLLRPLLDAQQKPRK